MAYSKPGSVLIRKIMLFLTRRKIKSLTSKAKILQQNRLHNQPKDEVILKEIKIYKILSTLYASLEGNKKYPFAKLMVMETLRAASAMGDTEATYQLAKLL